MANTIESIVRGRDNPGLTAHECARKISKDIGLNFNTCVCYLLAKRGGFSSRWDYQKGYLNSEKKEFVTESWSSRNPKQAEFEENIQFMDPVDMDSIIGSEGIGLEGRFLLCAYEKIRELPESLGYVISEYYLAGKSLREIGAVLGRCYETVRLRKLKALKILKEKVEKENLLVA